VLGWRASGTALQPSSRGSPRSPCWCAPGSSSALAYLGREERRAWAVADAARCASARADSASRCGDGAEGGAQLTFLREPRAYRSTFGISRVAHLVGSRPPQRLFPSPPALPGLGRERAARVDSRGDGERYVSTAAQGFRVNWCAPSATQGLAPFTPRQLAQLRQKGVGLRVMAALADAAIRPHRLQPLRQQARLLAQRRGVEEDGRRGIGRCQEMGTMRSGLAPHCRAGLARHDRAVNETAI